MFSRLVTAAVCSLLFGAGVASAEEPPARPKLNLSVGYHGLNRTLSWAGTRDATLSTTSTPFAGGVAAEGAWFPAAHVTRRFISNLGLFGLGEFTIGLKTTDSAGVVFGTSGVRLRGGVLLRVPVSESLDVELSGAFSRQTFNIAPTAAKGGKRPAVPGVSLTGPRGALGLRGHRFGRVGFDVQVGAVLPLNYGELGTADFFPRTRGATLDATAGCTVQLTTLLHVRVAVDWSRAFLNLNPDPAASLYATSAADQSLGVTVAIAWVL